SGATRKRHILGREVRRRQDQLVPAQIESPEGKWIQPGEVVARDASSERPALDEADDDPLRWLDEAQPAHDSAVVDGGIERCGAEARADGKARAFAPAVLVKVVMRNRNP